MTTHTRPAGARAQTRPAGRPLRLGSLCTGYGGLDMAVAAVLDVEPAWVADPDPGAAAILAHHWPDVPNLGDITVTDWTTVPPIDVLAAGYPCQPFSAAGLKKGTADERHLWPYVAAAVRVLRPRLVVLENVERHLRIGFADVLADLAALGFDAEWCIASASEIGAAHQRRRLIVLAWPAADPPDLRHQRRRETRGRRSGPSDHGLAAADSDRDASGDDRELPAGRHPVQQRVRDDAPRCGEAATDPARDGRNEGRPESTRLVRGSDASLGGHADVDWGAYRPAIDRWAATLGRPTPAPTEPGRDGRPRLSPLFVEWLMGLIAGHVTAVPGLTRNAQLKALGNGVVWQQGAAALDHLLDLFGAAL